MKILYYCWNECTSNDIMDVFKRKGYSLDCLTMEIRDKLNDFDFMNKLAQIIKKNSYDCIFSFNFFPVISKVANKLGIKYISWTYDSASMTLYSESVFNSCNYIFVYDRADVNKLKMYGINNVFHMPLGVNTYRLNKLLSNDICSTEYEYDVSFVGNLYNDQYNFYDQIQNMPEYYKGFFDGIINSQMNIYGYDLASDIITNDFTEVLNSFVRFNLDKEIFMQETDVFANILRKKITVVERPEVLKMISDENVRVTHFGGKSDERLSKVEYKGYLNYDEEMPWVFRKSKINLNITLRCILSGIPLRCMDIMGAGGFMLSNYQPELAEFFVDGKEMIMYSSRYDLMEKLHYFLNNDDERIEIAQRGKDKIEKAFSYEILLEKMFEIVF